MLPFIVGLSAALSGLTFYVHTFVGGKRVAGPLLKDQSLPFAAKWLGYYCWHITTILIGFMGVGFCWLTFHPHTPSLVFLGALTFALSALSAAVAIKAGIRPIQFPSTSLFAAIAATCLAALLAD